jgi:sn-glycerol 3-phosphate transport system ATP-binding protein
MGAALADSSIDLCAVVRRFGQVAALSDVSVTLAHGAFSVLLGPSGCGKSTLLRLIAGLDRPTSGSVHIGGRDVTELPPVARELSMVFQSYALFPHLNVRENILFGLSVRRTERAEQEARLARVAGMMGLSPLLARKPSELSGGQQQRVALARAVISERPICLMDEPLSNLDAKLRAEMRVELRALQQRLGLTVVYVTHDQVEAMTMADRIVVMNAGRIEQIGTPEEIYTQPASAFVAGFIGTPSMNLLPAAGLCAAGAMLPELPEGTIAGLRPEDLRIGPDGIVATVTGQEYLGADRIVSVDVNGVRVILRQPATQAAPSGNLRLTWPAAALHLFDGARGTRLPLSPASPPGLGVEDP